jgi:hypothetical protein
MWSQNRPSIEYGREFWTLRAKRKRKIGGKKLYLYLHEMNIRTNDVCKIAKNAFGK